MDKEDDNRDGVCHECGRTGSVKTKAREHQEWGRNVSARPD